MIHPDYPGFIDTVGSLFSLRESAKARALRKALGLALDRRFAPFQKGIVQEKKSQFINLAKQVSGVNWSVREPHKIITTLKNTGDGDEEMVCALYFLCCIADEFDELRNGLNHALGSVAVADKSGIWRAKSELRFHDLISGNAQEVRYKVKRYVEALHAQREDTQRRDRLNSEMKAEFETLVDGGAIQSPSGSDAGASGFLVDASDDKVVGRGFVENDAARFIETHSSPPCGTLSIIDIDDLTKINKVYGRDVGNVVIEIIGMLAEDAVKGLRQKTGRCGDDTFFAVLAREDDRRSGLVAALP